MNQEAPMKIFLAVLSLMCLMMFPDFGKAEIQEVSLLSSGSTGIHRIELLDHEPNTVGSIEFGKFPGNDGGAFQPDQRLAGDGSGRP